MYEKEKILTAPLLKKISTEDFEYAIQMTRWLLQPLGIWPIRTSNSSLILRTLSIAISVFLLGFLLIPSWLQMLLIEKDPMIKLKMIGAVSFITMNVFKYFVVLYKDDQISSCIIYMASDWYELKGAEQRSYMIDKAKTARVFTMVCAFFMYGGGLPYSAILPLTREAIIIGNKTIQPLAFPGYFIFFDPDVMPMHGLVIFMQALSAFVMYTVTIAVCSIAIICIMHICGQCSITSALLYSSTENFEKHQFRQIIQQHLRLMNCDGTPWFPKKFDVICIEHFVGHKKSDEELSPSFVPSIFPDIYKAKKVSASTVNRFASKLEDILNEICLIELIGCTFNICMLGYYFITDFEQSETFGTITFLMLLISLTFNIFIFCYIGDLLTQHCGSVGEVAYMTNWYKLSSKEVENFILIIIATQRPIVLTAGKMVTLSLQSFCNVLKASLTYLNMLRTFIRTV